MHQRQWLCGLLVAALLLLAVTRPQTAAAAQGGRVDPAELAGWLEPLIAEQMSQNSVPGAVFLLVQDGAVPYAKGFGLADIASGRAVDAETDVWRVMSISKALTAVAVMQLAEQGRLDLHTDVNNYLKSLRLPVRYPDPVTADNLLTHTAGLDFDLSNIGAEVRDATNLLPLASFLGTHPPERVRSPNRMLVYSNAAFDLLGLLVEDVGGKPYASYMDAHILAPMKMTSSTFTQPPPASDRLVTSYEYDGDYRTLPLPLYHNLPSRSLTASAPDIARFMLALLGGGELEDARMLNQGSVETLFSIHYAPGGQASGAAYGFDVHAWPGGRMLWKDGGAAGALSRVALFPEDGLGFFIAYNLDDGNALQNAVTQAFRKRYYPGSTAPPPPATAAAAPAEGVTGTYRTPDYSRSTIAKALRLMRDPYPRVEAAPDGSLRVTYNPGTEPAVLAPAGPLRFRDTKDGVEYAFVTDERGRVTHYAAGAYAAEKVEWYDVDRNHRIALGVLAALLAAAAIAWPAVALTRRRRSEERGSRFVTVAAAVLGFVAVVDLAVLALLFVTLNDPNLDYAVGLPPPLMVALVLTFVTGALSVGLLIASARVWRDAPLPPLGRAFFTLSSVVGVLVVLWLNYWNLLGWRW